MKKILLLSLLLYSLFSTNIFAVERVRLEGSSYEMGKQWAEGNKNLITALKTQFNAMASIFLKQTTKQLIEKSLSISKHMAKEDLDEIRGLADGTGVQIGRAHV